MHREWRMRHSAYLSVLNETEKGLAKSIAEQKSADVACSARLLSSKRKLDALLKETKTLSVQIDGHEEVLETENEKLKKEALKDLKQYSAELKELVQIAKPSASYEKAPIQQRSLLEVGAFTRERCLAFMDFAQKHSSGVIALKDVPKKACDEQREELQKAFEKAYKDLTSLKKEAKERSEDTSCFEDAKSEKMAKLTPLAAQREECVSKIEAANSAIAALEPVLDNLKERVEKLKHKIDKELVPECSEADEVSDTLAKIREIILALEECPGRSDFVLTIPKATPKGPAPVPAAKAKEVIAEAKEEVAEAKENIVEPDAAVEPEAAEPEAAAEPEEATEPEESAEPEEATEPEVAAEPEEAAEVEGSAEPG